MKPDPAKFQAMFDYHSQGDLLADDAQVDGIFVFGRFDSELPRQAASLYRAWTAGGYIMFSGGIGKDSGWLAEIEVPEAKYMAILANQFGIPTTALFLETQSLNGGDNARLGIDTIVYHGLPHDHLIALAHATSLRRLVATLRHVAKKKQFEAKISALASLYPFNPANPADQREAAGELLRLADYPDRDWCERQNDLPLDLVEYARAVMPEL